MGSSLLVTPEAIHEHFLHLALGEYAMRSSDTRARASVVFPAPGHPPCEAHRRIDRSPLTGALPRGSGGPRPGWEGASRYLGWDTVSTSRRPAALSAFGCRLTAG